MTILHRHGDISVEVRKDRDSRLSLPHLICKKLCLLLVVADAPPGDYIYRVEGTTAPHEGHGTWAKVVDRGGENKFGVRLAFRYADSSTVTLLGMLHMPRTTLNPDVIWEAVIRAIERLNEVSWVEDRLTKTANGARGTPVTQIARSVPPSPPALPPVVVQLRQPRVDERPSRETMDAAIVFVPNDEDIQKWVALQTAFELQFAATFDELADLGTLIRLAEGILARRTEMESMSDNDPDMSIRMHRVIHDASRLIELAQAELDTLNSELKSIKGHLTTMRLTGAVASGVHA
jgi:hypothetical protein